MSEIDSKPFPKGPLYAAGALIGLTIALTGATALGIIERAPTAQEARVAARQQIIKTRNFSFNDQPGGALIIRDTDTGKIAFTIKPGEPSGFIRGVLRGLARDRRSRGVGAEPPFALTLWANGALSLQDTVSQRTIELGSFGPDNRAAFAALLEPLPEAAK